MVVDPRKAQAEAESLLRRLPDTAVAADLRARSKLLIGEGMSRNGDTDGAIAVLSAATADLPRSAQNAELRADLLVTLGATLTDAGQIGGALTRLQEAYRIYVLRRVPRGRAKALIFLGLLYNRARDFPATLRYLDEAGQLRGLDDKLRTAIYNGRGFAYEEMKRYDLARQEFAAAVLAAERTGSPAFRVSTLGNLAHVQAKLGEYDAASRSIRAGLRVANTTSSVDRPWLFAAAALIAQRRGDPAGALRYIRQRFAGVDLDATGLPDRDAHQIAYDIYSASGDTVAALAHLRALKRLDDQATEIARSSSAALAAARFDYANQELRIARLKSLDLQRSVAFERDRARTQRTMFLAIAGATLLLVALLAGGLLAIRRSRDKVRAANADLETSNAALGRALAAKTEFLAATSHEIRTPLNGILGMTEVLIADDGVTGRTRDRLEIVHGAGRVMRALVDDLLDMAKIESGKMTIERHPFDAAALVGEACRLWEDRAREKGLAFHVTVDAAPDLVLGDATRVRQVVSNLLSNAFKFTQVGEVALVMECGERLVVRVSDSGIGIAADALETIFDTFRQADAGTTRRFGGSGLGLSICRDLARAMGGDVMVTSEEGVGSTFTLDLPVERVPIAREPAEEPSRAGLVILDPNPISRAMLSSIFSSAVPVTSAGNAEEAERALAAAPDAVLLVEEQAADALPRLTRGQPHRRVVVLEKDGAGPLPPGVEVIRRPIAKRALVERVLRGTVVLEQHAA